jgi:hypothetical protein
VLLVHRVSRRNRNLRPPPTSREPARPPAPRPLSTRGATSHHPCTQPKQTRAPCTSPR